MHHGEDLIVLGVLFVVAYVLGRLGRTIGLPAIPIYMVVGLLASPNFHLFPLDFESSYIELTAVFGLILLLFNLGLEFDQDEFYGNAARLILSGGSYIAVNMAAGLAFGFVLGWGSREALIIAGITATSSSAIVTKLLIELKRLANPETPMILGVTVVEDIFIAVYLAIVSVVLSGETEPWPVVLKLVIAFAFLVVMFAIARWGGRVVSRFFRTRDDELFTILFFGLAILFGGIGEVLGVTDAIGAFLIGLVIGATRFRARVERIAIPLRDVFGAFFFVNFGLGLDPGAFPDVVLPVIAAAVMTIVLNLGAGQFVAWLNKLGPRAGLNAAFILHNRGEFALILATLSLSAGLDERIQPFAGLYVLIMAIVGPILASRSESIGQFLSRRRHRPKPATRSAMAEEDFALVEAAMADGAADERPAADPAEAPVAEPAPRPRRPVEPDELDDEFPDPMRQALIDQAMQQSDGIDSDRPRRPREPDY
ncbi:MULTISPECIES: cation:proton antiporter [unclassified Rathayibacter]|jgi:CPA2 family monovalent cation:H+ antiporter-2|uniref:cation:proton antiporter n=1 Tax=unclassified Rathayibacter TaxID=2609250 RepID=UPI000F4A1D27|nr:MULTISPECIES: cation:proton antiporter [unclassified Rathayibacter]MCJ1686086.1 cation:proton antiporter [Rathayibacter sp. VKM Ac-2927]MCJ1705177.1 cation:proton antiporter [Rathayibacter sp. VKM Ac-2926]ROP57298.1 potassium/proton antiporter membrane subunit (CPA2 family) [Rathayibacter sp. PhB186]ROQ15975.1 potassium/proton antiporter membrane subunit (CPA2 family) [Rathayibacter sp. PhB93]ROQ57379.1 potassium/proton antiporter membrane subunit (CPA2 family) [Rathayibacter sp. PhB152]